MLAAIFPAYFTQTQSSLQEEADCSTWELHKDVVKSCKHRSCVVRNVGIVLWLLLAHGERSVLPCQVEPEGIPMSYPLVDYSTYLFK